MTEMDELQPDEAKTLAELSSSANRDVNLDDQYKEDEEIQRNIVGMLLTNKQFLLQSMGLIQPHYFTNEAHELISKIVYKHFDKYHQLPSKQIVCQEVEDEIANKKVEIKQYYRTEMNVVYDYYIPGVEDREYLLNRITNFAKTQSLKVAFHKSLEELKKKQTQDTWLKIHNILIEALTIDRSFEPGLEYFQTFEERYVRMALNIENGEVFTSGFPAIDNALIGGGLSRGEMASWMGPPGTGKSLALVTAALSNMHQGKKVLYISLEMDQDKVAERFDAQLADPTRQYGVTVNNLLAKQEIVMRSLKEYAEELEDPRTLIVKQFPAGHMDVPTFRAFHTQLKLRGFNPDLIIIDYIGEMKDYPGMPTWESRNKIVRDLRGFSVEEDICLFTAMQPDKKAREMANEQKELAFIDDSNLADAYGQSRPLDALWTINQFQDEKDCSIARIFIAKHRHGKSRFQFQVQFDYDVLSIKEISQNKYSEIFKNYRNSKEVINAKKTEEKIIKQRQVDQLDGIIGTADTAMDAMKAIGSSECGEPDVDIENSN